MPFPPHSSSSAFWQRLRACLVVPALLAAPRSLLTGQSSGCPNPLTPLPSNHWDVATGQTPWHAQCNGAPPAPATPVPTLGPWALSLLALAAGALGWRSARRRVV